MNFQVTARDKKLLYVLAIFLVLVLPVYFLILPEVDKGISLREQLAVAQQEYQTMALQQSGIPGRQAQVRQAEESLAELAEPLYTDISSTQVDRLLNELLLDHGFVPLEMTISKGDAALSVYGEGTDGEKQTVQSAVLSSVVVSGSARGSQDALPGLLDALCGESPALRVRAFSLRTIMEEVDGTLHAVTELSYEMELYGYAGMEAPEV